MQDCYHTDYTEDPAFVEAQETGILASVEGEVGEALPGYFSRLLRMPLLTASEEVDLIQRAQEGEEEARTRLVECNLRLVLSVAKQYQRPGLPIEDLIQEGVIGLLKAIARFEIDRGYRFSTYATHWIRQSITRAVDNTSGMIRIPTHAVDALRKIEKARAALRRSLNREPNYAEIGQMVQMSAKKVERLMLLTREPLSLDQLVHPDSNLSLIAMLEDPCVCNPEEVAVHRAWISELHEAISSLSEREQWAVRRRLGIEEADRPPDSKVRLSRERLRQLETQALKKLRQWARKHLWHEWLSK